MAKYGKGWEHRDGAIAMNTYYKKLFIERYCVTYHMGLPKLPASYYDVGTTLAVSVSKPATAVYYSGV